MIPSLAKLTINVRTERIGGTDKRPPMSQSDYDRKILRTYRVIESCSSRLLNAVLSSWSYVERQKLSRQMFIASMYFVAAHSGMFGLIKHNTQTDYQFFDGDFGEEFHITQDVFSIVTKLVGLLLTQSDDVRGTKECVDMLLELSTRCFISKTNEFDWAMAQHVVAHNMRRFTSAEPPVMTIPVPTSQVVQDGKTYVTTSKKGSFGNLWLVRNDVTCEVHSALKRIRFSPQLGSGHDLLRIVREVVVMRRIKEYMNETGDDYPLVTLINLHFWVDDAKFAVFDLEMPYSDAGTVSTYVRGDAMNPELKRSVCKQILQGLKHLHAMCIVHLDLKPENMLVFPQEGNSVNIKIIDFGASRSLLESTRYPWTESDRASHVTTRWYEPPELLNIMYGPPTYKSWFCFSYKADIWSAALCIFYVRTKLHMNSLLPSNCNGHAGHMQFAMVVTALLQGDRTLSQEEQIKLVREFLASEEFSNLDIFQNQFSTAERLRQSMSTSSMWFLEGALQQLLPLLRGFDTTLLDLLKNMLQFDLEKRYNAQECLDHDFFSTT